MGEVAHNIEKSVVDIASRHVDWRAILAADTPLERIRSEEVEPAEQVVLPPYVPAKFTSETLDSYKPVTQSQAVALRAVQAFCRSIHNNQPQLLALIGTTGCGKSHLLYAAAKALHQINRRVFTRPWYLLADQLRYGGPALWRDVRLEPGELREAIMGEGIVMIDEVRPTAGTAFDDTELAKIVCGAWDNGRSVLVTTNVNPLTEVVGPAVASRFTQITITGPDRRQQR